jgi:hypothetical protein
MLCRKRSARQTDCRPSGMLSCGTSSPQLDETRNIGSERSSSPAPALSPLTTTAPLNSANSNQAPTWASGAAQVRPMQGRFSDHSVPGTFLAQCMNLLLLPKLSNWPISRHYLHAQGDQKLLEGCRREDSSRNRSALCPFQWNTWQQSIHPRTCCPCTIDILGNWFLPSMHKPRRKHHIAQ